MTTKTNTLDSTIYPRPNLRAIDSPNYPHIGYLGQDHSRGGPTTPSEGYIPQSVADPEGQTSPTFCRIHRSRGAGKWMVAPLKSLTKGPTTCPGRKVGYHYRAIGNPGTLIALPGHHKNRYHRYHRLPQCNYQVKRSSIVCRTLSHPSSSGTSEPGYHSVCVIVQ